MQPSPTAPLTFTFIRHGKTEPNMRGVRCGGDYDVPLATQGIQQCLELRDTLREMALEFDVLRVSPLMRTRETARILAHLWPNAQWKDDADLRERALGRWNGRGVAETEIQLAAAVTPPGGESEADFRTRVVRAVRRIEADAPLRTLVVASSGVARVIHAVIGGEGRLRLPNAQLVRFRFGFGAEDVPAHVNSLRLESGSA